MPIIINSEPTVTSTQKAPPATDTPNVVFHRDMNGRGKTNGRLHKGLNPAELNGLETDPVGYSPVRPDKAVNDKGIATKTTHTIPVHPLLSHTYFTAARQMALVTKSALNSSDPDTRATAPGFLTVPVTFKPEQLLELTGDAATGSPMLTNDSVFTAHNFRVFAHMTPEVVAITKNEYADGGNSNKQKTESDTGITWRINLLVVDADDVNTPLEIDPDLEYDDEDVEAFLNNCKCDPNGEIITVPDDLNLPVITDVLQDMPLHTLRLLNNLDGGERPRSFVLTTSSYLPQSDLSSMLDDLTGYLDSSAQYPQARIDDEQFTEWSHHQFNIYDHVLEHSRTWISDRMADWVCPVIAQIHAATQSAKALKAAPNYSELCNALAHYLRSMEHYSVTLPAYASIYTALVATNNPVFQESMLRQNMQVALNGHLDTLSQMREELPHAATPAIDPLPDWASPEQRAVATTDSPLVIAEAGAGTGKSTTILSRLDYLIAGGCPPEEITVLSFTNAAADNITAKNPRITSRTNARMIMDVYQHNFPTHELSTLDTVLNSLDIYYGTQMTTNQFMAALRKFIYNANKDGDTASMTALSEFIARYTKEVIEVLNTIRQSSLELHIIICYLLADTLVEPFAAPKHIIIDEVQDNSIFEFVYALRYAIKHKAALFLVGDSSQTLYEFRSANPKALNALEGSGVFDTFQLNTNYRSTQEILDFANVALHQIEANQFAKIQLKSNILSTPTAKSFAEAVKMYDIGVNRYNPAEDVPAAMQSLYGDLTKDFQSSPDHTIAVLARSRREVNAAYEKLTEMFPNEQVANLVSERVFTWTTFSSYISKYWDEVIAVPVGDAAFIFTQQVKAHLYELEKPRNGEAAENHLSKQIAGWWSGAQNYITGCVEQVNNGVLTEAEFHNRLRESILDYEIRTNSIRQVMTQNNNQKNKEDNANARLFVSTVHGVKGLEFDTTVVIRSPEGRNSVQPEEDKRLLYVALTRAKQHEHILSFQTGPQSRISIDYSNVLANLTTRDAHLAEAQTEQEERDRFLANDPTDDERIEQEEALSEYESDIDKDAPAPETL